MSLSTKKLAWGAALCVGLAVAAPALSEELADFSHRVHVKASGLECAACHKQTAAGVELLREGCADCHDDGTPAWKLEPKARRLGISFPHEAHARQGECLDCHQAVLSTKNTEGKPILELEGCTRCHEKKQVRIAEASCARCHGGDARKLAPSDHRGTWIARHGAEARMRVFEEHGRDCRACHGRDACAKCHRERRPRSHTGLWRVRLHGSAAAWDRESCKTCHETSTCTRCHSSTRPMNHTAAWRSTHGLAAGGFGNESCAVCHRPAQCASCHRAGSGP